MKFEDTGVLSCTLHGDACSSVGWAKAKRKPSEGTKVIKRIQIMTKRSPIHSHYYSTTMIAICYMVYDICIYMYHVYVYAYRLMPFCNLQQCLWPVRMVGTQNDMNKNQEIGVSRLCALLRSNSRNQIISKSSLFTCRLLFGKGRMPLKALISKTTRSCQ